MSPVQSPTTAEPKVRKSAAIRWLLVIAWMAVIYYFSDQPNSNEVTQQYFGGFNFFVRKAAHVTEYTILFLLSRFALMSTAFGRPDPNQPAMRLSKGTALALLITIAYACTDEFHQSFVSGRSGAAGDVAIDAMGPILIVLLVAIGKSIRAVGNANSSSAPK